jgi:lipoprotein NlpI
MQRLVLPTLLTLGTALSVLAQDSAEKSPNELFRQGVDAFFEARIDASAEAFDDLVERVPDAKPQLWQRGLTLYYADRFADGRDQFESHQTYNRNDVENAAWHFLCVARAEDVEAARKALIPIKGDGRVPMAQVHDLFAGTGTPEQVLEAAKNSDAADHRNHFCYAHLYLGLYFEAIGDDEKAKHHMLLAANNYAMDHYMGKTAQVHVKVRGWSSAEADSESNP